MPNLKQNKCEKTSFCRVITIFYRQFQHFRLFLAATDYNFMPKDNSIKSVLIIGSGPIIIGQACEFDYSGTQAARSLARRRNKSYSDQQQPGHHHDRPDDGR